LSHADIVLRPNDCPTELSTIQLFKVLQASAKSSSDTSSTPSPSALDKACLIVILPAE
jgi:hypothetical protein